LWIVTLQKPDGTYPTSSSYAGHRSGLFHLFRLYKKQMYTVFSTELGNSYLGRQQEERLGELGSKLVKIHFQRSCIDLCQNILWQ
jgi:hypothetical protein